MKEYSDLPAVYIAVEGPGGAGKSANTPFIAKLWQEYTGREVFLTREPGGPTEAEQIREKLFVLKKMRLPVSDLIDVLYDARVITVREHVKPNLKAGRIVLTDRYAASTYAFEGGGNGLPLNYILQAHKDRIGMFGPSLTYFFTLSDVAVGMQRRENGGGVHAFSQESLEFHRIVLANYEELYEHHRDLEKWPADPIFGHWVKIDGTVSLEEVHKQLEETTQQYLKLLKKRVESGLPV